MIVGVASFFITSSTKLKLVGVLVSLPCLTCFDLYFVELSVLIDNHIILTVLMERKTHIITQLRSSHDKMDLP